MTNSCKNENDLLFFIIAIAVVIIDGNRLAKLAFDFVSTGRMGCRLPGHRTWHQKFRQSVIFPRTLPLCHHICIAHTRRYVGGCIERYFILPHTAMAWIIKSQGMWHHCSHRHTTEQKTHKRRRKRNGEERKQIVLWFSVIVNSFCLIIYLFPLTFSLICL